MRGGAKQGHVRHPLVATQAPVAVCADDVRKGQLHCIEGLIHDQRHLLVGDNAFETAAAVVQACRVSQCLRSEMPYLFRPLEPTAPEEREG